MMAVVKSLRFRASKPWLWHHSAFCWAVRFELSRYCLTYAESDIAAVCCYCG